MTLRRPLWVNRVGLTMSTARPVYPQLWKYFGVAANRRDGPAKKLASVESSVELFPLSILNIAITGLVILLLGKA